MFLKPHELEQIKRDFLSLIDGLDASAVILHWTEGAGEKDVYGRHPSTEEKTLEVKAVVEEVSNHNATVRAIQAHSKLDLQTGDMLFLFKPDVDLSGKEDLWFEVPGYGNFRPETEGPTDAHPHSTLFPNQNILIQEIRARPKR